MEIFLEATRTSHNYMHETFRYAHNLELKLYECIEFYFIVTSMCQPNFTRLHFQGWTCLI